MPTVIEELVIAVRYDVDSKKLAQARAEARKVAQGIGAEFQRAGLVAVEAAEDTAAANNKASRSFSEVWTGALRQVGARLTNFAANGAKAIAKFVSDTFTDVRELDTFALSINKSTTEIQALEKGFERVRVPADNTREALKTLQENLGELRRLGTGPAADSLGSLGLSLKDFEGLDAEAEVKVLAQAFADLEDAEKATSIATELMGEDGRALLPALLDGADGVDKLTMAAREAGQVMDQETIEATRELDTRIKDLQGRAEGFALSLLGKATPALEKAADTTEQWVSENEELIEQGVPAAIDLITQAATGAATAILALANGMRSLRDEFRVNDSGEDILATFDRIEARGGKLTAAQEAQRRQIRQSAANTRQRSRELQGDGALVVPEGFERVTTRGREAGEDLPNLIQSAQNRTRAAQLALIEQRRAQERDFNKRQRAAKAAAFEEGEKAKSSGKGGGGGKRRNRGPSSEAVAQAEALREEFSRIGGRFGATDQGIENAIADAARTFDRGGNIAAARKSGLGTIGRLTDTANIEKQISQDPLSKLLGVDVLPDVSPAEIAQDRAPQVLTATINNNWNIEQRFDINGADRPDLIPDRITDAFRSLFQNEIQKTSKYGKVNFAR